MTVDFDELAIKLCDIDDEMTEIASRPESTTWIDHKTPKAIEDLIVSGQSLNRVKSVLQKHAFSNGNPDWLVELFTDVRTRWNEQSYTIPTMPPPEKKPKPPTWGQTRGDITLTVTFTCNEADLRRWTETNNWKPESPPFHIVTAIQEALP